MDNSVGDYSPVTFKDILQGLCGFVKVGANTGAKNDGKNNWENEIRKIEEEENKSGATARINALVKTITPEANARQHRRHIIDTKQKVKPSNSIQNDKVVDKENEQEL